MNFLQIPNVTQKMNSFVHISIIELYWMLWVKPCIKLEGNCELSSPIDAVSLDYREGTCWSTLEGLQE